MKIELQVNYNGSYSLFINNLIGYATPCTFVYFCTTGEKTVSPPQAKCYNETISLRLQEITVILVLYLFFFRFVNFICICLQGKRAKVPWQISKVKKRRYLVPIVIHRSKKNCVQQPLGKKKLY